jgi:hypothetical protein
VRYGLLLDKAGRQNEAKAVLNEVLIQLKRAPKYVRRVQAEWIALAEKALRGRDSVIFLALSAVIGFGIDLAGYTTGKTSLAVVEIRGKFATATLLRGSALSIKRDTSSPLKEILRQEVDVLRRCLTVGPVAIDIPIDLQDLTTTDRAEFVW